MARQEGARVPSRTADAEVDYLVPANQLSPPVVTKISKYITSSGLLVSMMTLVVLDQRLRAQWLVNMFWS